MFYYKLDYLKNKLFLFRKAALFALHSIFHHQSHQSLYVVITCAHTCTTVTYRALMPRSALLVAPRGRKGHQGKPGRLTLMGKTAGQGPALTQAASLYPTILSLSIRLRRKESRKRLI